ncbi:MAG TPA: LysR family transcriptional regulator [Sphingomonas sp.]|jgi:DNA-binding transcriptional LysR family regulator|uniref:LysR family transcriptional regulator n=1 Tax=Sphingomonas sp. TaxID=28214 RepID=UPI002ED95C18
MVDPDYDLFAAIVATGSISAAARRLAISPPMASKRLARLERRLGTQLVHRSTRRLALTQAGAAFHDDVVAILAAVAAAEARVSGHQRDVRGPLRLSGPTSFGRLHLAPHLGLFLDAYPGVDLRFDLSDGFSDLIADRIDVAVRIAPAIDSGLTAHRLGTSRRILCAAPAYLAAHGHPNGIAALADHRLLAADGQLPWRLEGPDGPVIVDRRSHVGTNSSEVVRELTLAGVGIALRSLWDVDHDIAAGRLARVLVDHEGSVDVGIYAVHPAAGLIPPAVTALVDWLRALYAAPAPWERAAQSSGFRQEGLSRPRSRWQDAIRSDGRTPDIGWEQGNAEDL